MIDKIFKGMGWKTLSGRWDKREVYIDLLTVTLLILVILVAAYVK